MAITRYESYYAKIYEQIRNIKEENGYVTDSIAFAHWYLEKYRLMTEQEIAEAIIDGDGDLGIDAIIIDEENNALTVFQFKLPKKENINKEIDQGELLKTWNGFNTLVSNDRSYGGSNEKFREYKEQLTESFITSFRICFVSYNKGVIANRDIVESNVGGFRRDTGSEVEVIYHDRDAIANIYERLNRENRIKISLKYKQMQSAYNVQERKIDSHVGFVNGIDLVNAISENIVTIFDENIRLYEYGSSINSDILRTASSTDQADMFYFYNNGVVFICDKAHNSPASNEIVLEGASVVNGCQTLNVLYDANQKRKLNSEVCVLIRVIVIDDYSERMKITEYLNSQTPIRDSYFISNHPIIRDLQKQLMENGLFLERQINEYDYLNEHGDKVNAKRVIQLEKALQYYVGYWVNKNASAAKRGKNVLFDKNKTEDLLSDISAGRVVEALEAYDKVSEVLTMYRKTRRNSSKTDFSKYINQSQEWVLEHLDEFRFMNTGDIIIINAYANLKRKYDRLGINDYSDQELITDSIHIIRDILRSEQETNTSLLTKNASIFSRMQETIEQLSERYRASSL